MKRHTVEQTFTLHMQDIGADVTATVHHIDFDNSDARDEYVGTVILSIEGSETYQHSEFAIWGNGEAEEESKHDFSGCYICLPTVLEEPDEDEEDEELEVYSLSDLEDWFDLNL